MDPPMMNVELIPEGKIEDANERDLAFHCQLYDTEVVHKIAQMFLPGLASACVDNTSGDMFRSPGSVAVDIRQEMINYLTQRSESFVAESIILEATPDKQVSDHPYDIIADFVDDFASSKRNLFSRVSGWLLSEKREDKIDDFGQEMDLNGFWLMDRREAIAQNLLKNVDFKSTNHCDMKFNTAEELAAHGDNCGFRSMNCTNDGCIATFCASHADKHDSICPFKIIPCEQKCPEFLIRREMDKHCITICPMKLVNCPFYSVGCQFTVPRCLIQQHNSDDLHSHLLCILKRIHKGVCEEDLKQRVDQIVQSSSDQLREAKDARSLTFLVKDIEVKLGPLEIKTNKESSEPSSDTAKKDEDSSLDGNRNREFPTSDINRVSEEAIEAARTSSEQSTENLALHAKVIEVGTNPVEQPYSGLNEETEAAEKSGERGIENQILEVKVDSTKASEDPDANKLSEEAIGAARKSSEHSTEDSISEVNVIKDAINPVGKHYSDVNNETEAANGSHELGIGKSIPNVKVIENSTKASELPMSDLNQIIEPIEAVKKSSELSNENSNPEVKVIEDSTRAIEHPTLDLNEVREEPTKGTKNSFEQGITENPIPDATAFEDHIEAAKESSKETTHDGSKIDGNSEDFSATIVSKATEGSVEFTKKDSSSSSSSSSTSSEEAEVAAKDSRDCSILDVNKVTEESTDANNKLN